MLAAAERGGGRVVIGRERRWTILVCPVCDAVVCPQRPDDTPVCFGRGSEHERAVAVPVKVVADTERTSFEVEEIAVDLAEAMDEVRREPRTSLWRSFWDRLTEGGEAPGWPFEDDEPPHLVAPSPMVEWNYPGGLSAFLTEHPTREDER